MYCILSKCQYMPEWLTNYPGCGEMGNGLDVFHVSQAGGQCGVGRERHAGLRPRDTGRGADLPRGRLCRQIASDMRGGKWGGEGEGWAGHSLIGVSTGVGQPHSKIPLLTPPKEM